MSYAEEALPYTLKKLEEAEVIQEPYPHMEIEGIFQPDYYKSLLENWPLYSDMASENSGVRRLELKPDPAVGSECVTFKDISISPRATFWRDFTKSFLSGKIQESLFKKYSIEAQPNIEVGRLVVDQKGAGFGPHTDRFDKLCAIMFYTPYDNGYRRECDTLMFEPYDRNVAWTQEHYKFEEFKLVKRIVYRPNVFFSFKNCRVAGGPWSFHGYNQTTDYNRQTIKCFIQKDIDPETVRAVTNEHYQRSQRWRKETDNA